MEKENTHIVIKHEDILKYLTESEQVALECIMDKITHGREKDKKKPINYYYVVNKDEPYAKVIHDIILGGEAGKLKNGR